jgi:hypothetical protein
MKSGTKLSVFGALLISVIVLTLLYSFYKFYFVSKYITYDFAPCTPEEKNCFVRECAEDDPRCINSAIGGQFYFSIVEKNSTKVNEIFCSEENIDLYVDIAYDAICSTE